jgi:urease accessory protein
MKPTRSLILAAGLSLLAAPASAHVGVGDANSFAAGIAHPFLGLDHLIVMIAVGAWAVMKGGRALWAWPVAFVTVMLIGGGLAMFGVAMPFVEPAILASVVALGLLVALAVDLPVWAGGAIVGLFALFHGHAHGSEIPASAGGLDYAAGFALATVGLHVLGIALATGLGARFRFAARAAGAVSAAVGIGLFAGLIG